MTYKLKREIYQYNSDKIIWSLSIAVPKDKLALLPAQLDLFALYVMREKTHCDPKPFIGRICKFKQVDNILSNEYYGEVLQKIIDMSLEIKVLLNEKKMNSDTDSNSS